MALFRPRGMFHRVTDITPDYLNAEGIKGLALDADNTLSTHHSQQADEGVEQWLDAMRSAGVKLIMVSNSKNRRVEPFARKLGLEYTAMACKPLPFGFRRACKALGLKPCELAAVGDQLFTDMLGAHLAGVIPILVEPILLEDSAGFKFKRLLEKPFTKRYKQKLYKSGS